MQEPISLSDVTTKISQDPGVNNELETVLIYRCRKKDNEYIDVLFKEPALSPDPCDVLWPYQYLKVFVTTEMLQTIYRFQRLGENMRIPCTAKELEKSIGC